MSLITAEDITLRVSSVLNKDVKQYGKQYLIDGKDDTCWQSDQGSNQWIECRFRGAIRLKTLSIEFQGGFAAKQFSIQLFDSNNGLLNETLLYGNDKNDLQVFNGFPECDVNCLKIVFNQFFDPFGRLIVYKLQLFQ